MLKGISFTILLILLLSSSVSAFCLMGLGDCQDIFIPKVRNADQIFYSNVLDGNTVLSEFLAETIKDGYITNNGDPAFPDVNVNHVEISITGDLNIFVTGMTAFVDGNIFSVNSLDVDLSDNTKTFIYIKNDGSNTYTVSASDPQDQNVFTFALVGEAFTAQGEVLHVHEHPPIKRELSILNKNIDLAFGTIVISGLSVTVNQASTDFSVTSGSWLLNFQDLHELTPLYSTLTKGVTWHFHSGGDAVQSKDNSGLNFTQWDNGTDLTGVNAGRWYTDFVFVLEHEMSGDSNVHVAISDTEHVQLANAQAEDFVVPFGFSGVAVPIARIVRKGNQTDFSALDTFVFIEDIRNTGAGGGGAGGGGGTQNIWATIDSDSGSTTANTISDTLTIAGGSFVTTSIIGDTLTIDSQDSSCDNNSDCTLTGNVNSVNGEFVNLTVTGITKTEADLTVFDDFNAGVSGSFPLIYRSAGSFSLFGGDASGTASTAIGVLSVSTGPYSTAIGFEAEAIGTSTIAMNNLSFATGNYAMAFGNLASADGVDTVAIGLGADASVSGGPGGCVAIGFGSVCRDLGVVTLSKDVNVSRDLNVLRNATINGILTAGFFVGDGSQISGVPAENILAGTLSGNYVFTGTGNFLGTQLTVTSASNPIIGTIDTTNNVTTVINSQNTFGFLGTLSNHPFFLATNNIAQVSLDTFGNMTLVNGDLSINNASNPFLKISEGGVSGAAISITHISDTQGRITLASPAGASLRIDITPADGTSNANFELFRLTNTTGQRRWIMYKGDGSGTVAHSLPSSIQPIIWNNDAGDRDFSIRGTIDASLFYLNAAFNRIGFGDSTPDFKVEIFGSSNLGYFGITETVDGDVFEVDSSGNTIVGNILQVDGDQINDSGGSAWISSDGSQNTTLAGTLESGTITSTGTIGTPSDTITLGVGVNTFAITSNVVVLTGDGGGNSVSLITGGQDGQLLTIIFTDGFVTLTDTPVHVPNSMDLTGNITGADDTVIQLVYDGTSWYQVSAPSTN